MTEQVFTDTEFHQQQMDLSFSERYYVDADFSTEATRAGRMTGCLEETHEPGAISPLFGETFRSRVVPREEWDNLYSDLQPDYARRKYWQYDQDGEGTCTSNATSGAYCYQLAKTFGRQNAICPAPPSMYYYCSSGPNSGSSTSCNLKRIRDYGCLPIDTPRNREMMQKLGLNPDHVLPAVGWSGPRRLDRDAIPGKGDSPNKKATCYNFRIDEFYEITSVDEFFSALLHGFSILYGRSGHAIHGVDIVKRSGDWFCKYDNSWGKWGESGFGFDSISYIQRTNAYRWAYAFQSVVVPNGADNLLSF